jgi:lipid A disaccharide synthetase
MLHGPRESLRARLGLILFRIVFCSWWRGARDAAPHKTLLDLGPVNLRGVPSVVGGVDRVLRRRTLLATELMQNNRMCMLDIDAPMAGLEVLLVDLNIHA